MDTQNITLAVPKALLKQAKILAARRETSVSALVIGSLRDLVRQDEAIDRAMRRAVARARRGYDLGTGGRLTVDRDDLHER